MNLNPSWLVWSGVSSHTALSLHLSDELSELLCHDDSTINIIMAVVIVFTRLTLPS